MRDGHAEVGLLDAPEHLLVERLLQRLGRLHDRLGVGVLRLEIRDDFRVRLLAQPEVVVVQRVAVNFVSCGIFLATGGRVATPLWASTAGARSAATRGAAKIRDE